MIWEFVDQANRHSPGRLVAIWPTADLKTFHERLLADDQIWRKPRIRPSKTDFSDAREWRGGGLLMKFDTTASVSAPKTRGLDASDPTSSVSDAKTPAP